MTHHQDDCSGGGGSQPIKDGIVEGTSGADRIDLYYTGDPQGDQIDHNDAILPGAAPNDDVVLAGAGNDTVMAGEGNDLVHADNGNDVVFGGNGNDTLLGEAGNDQVSGDAGNDVIHGDSGDDTLFGGDGNDTIDGGTGNDQIEGGSGDDSLIGGAGDDSICAGDGNDTIDAGDGNDLAFGAGGNDVIAGGAGNDTLVGGAGSDTIDGGTGNDVIYGDGGTCADNTVTITFDGDVTAAYLNSIGVYEIDPATGAISNTQMAWENASAQGSGGDLHPGVSSYTFTVTPGAQVGLFMVSNGDNQNDYSSLGAGHYEFVNASGDPATIHDTAPQLVYAGDNGTTTDIQGGVFHSAGYGSDVNLNTDGDQHLADGGLQADGSINIGMEDMVHLGDHDFNDAELNISTGAGVGFANPFHDITGTPVEDTSGNADDSLSGGDGNDLVYGGNGDDTIDGGAGNDTLDGGNGGDHVNGGDGNDVITGDGGNDTINGGEGQDTLEGGDDRDTFVVGSAEAGNGDVVHGGSGGDDHDTLDLSGVGAFRLTDVTTDSDGNGIDGKVEFLDTHGAVTGSMSFTNIEEVVPCFTPGTLIATPKGERPVEDLMPGDKVITRDNGIQEISWIGRKTMDWKALRASPHLQPVLVRAGSLGDGLPERDMMVSPNHRILVANERTALYFDEHEVLVAAKHVVNNQGIHTVDSIGTTYIHFMFERHEVVLSNGAWTESFQPGDYTLKGMGNAQRSEIYEVFPELKTPEGVEGYTAARKTLKRHEAMLLAK